MGSGNRIRSYLRMMTRIVSQTVIDHFLGVAIEAAFERRHGAREELGDRGTLPRCPMLLAALTLTLLACGGDDTTTATTDSVATTASDSATTDSTTVDTGPAEVTDLSVQELKAWLDEGKDFLFINVHVPYAGEIPGTDVHIPYTATDDLVAEIGDDLNRLTVLYCLTGPMSAKAAGNLVELGYRNIHDLPEAMNGWEAAGYELSE